jgi:hypothetical protein
MFMSILKPFAPLVALLAAAGCNASGIGKSVPAHPANSAVGLNIQRSHVPARGVAPYALPANVRAVCDPNTPPGFAHCEALVRTDIEASRPRGYGPTDLQAAYNLPAGQGSGQMIAVIDAFDDPNAEADLGVYRSTFGLPPCTTANGCFKKLNQQGAPGPYPSPSSGWAVEISLDIDMVSAGCPRCSVTLVEANDSSFANLSIAVKAAVDAGAVAVSNSYIGQGGSPRLYDFPGHIILASAGDGGYGAGEPAAFPTVVSVGGTHLTKGGSGRGWTETVWAGTGCGCTVYSKPSWQRDKGCMRRTMNDVAADADPATGVAIYDTYQNPGWQVSGGTSVSSPLVGSMYGLAGNGATINAAQSIYTHRADFYDITVGSAAGSCTPKYLCSARHGYDGPTGIGTPNGVRGL